MFCLSYPGYQQKSVSEAFYLDDDGKANLVVFKNSRDVPVLLAQHTLDTLKI